MASGATHHRAARAASMAYGLYHTLRRGSALRRDARSMRRGDGVEVTRRTPRTHHLARELGPAPELELADHEPLGVVVRAPLVEEALGQLQESRRVGGAW